MSAARPLLRRALATLLLGAVALGPLHAAAALAPEPRPAASTRRSSSRPSSSRPSSSRPPASASAASGPRTPAPAAGAAPPAAAAQTDAVAAAERAYKEVDFATQLEQANRALEQGEHDAVTLANIYRLLGIAHAALGEPEAAKQAFIRLLAIDPDVALERVLSPRLRTPYMEARGFWDVSSSRLAIEVARDEASGGLTLTLSDPLEMTRRVRLTSAAPDSREVVTLAAEPRLRVESRALAPHAGVPLQIELLDPHDNVILKRLHTPPPPPAAATRVPAASAARARRSAVAPAPEVSGPSALPWLLGGGALLGLGVGATAHVIRENRAQEWNGVGCEQTGRGTRAEQCPTVDDRRRSAQTVAIIGYATGGALLAASVVSYLLGDDVEPDPTPPRPTIACGPSPLAWGLSCNSTW